MPSTPAHWWIARKLILQCYFIFCSQLPILSFFQQRMGEWGRLWSLFPQFLSLYPSGYSVLLSLITLQKSGGRRIQLWHSIYCTAASVPKSRAPTLTWSMACCLVLLAPTGVCKLWAVITSPPCAPSQKDIKQKGWRTFVSKLQLLMLPVSKITSATWQETDPTHFSWMVHGNFPGVLPGWEKLPDWLGNMLLPPCFSESASVASSGHCDDLPAVLWASLPGLLDTKTKCSKNSPSSVGFLEIEPFNIL